MTLCGIEMNSKFSFIEGLAVCFVLLVFSFMAYIGDYKFILQVSALTIVVYLINKRTNKRNG